MSEFDSAGRAPGGRREWYPVPTLQSNPMQMDIHLYVHTVDPGTDAKLDQILNALAGIKQQEKIIVSDLTALTTQVTANTDAEASAIQLLTNISAALRAAGSDPVAIGALATQLETSRSALAKAVVDNTPADNTPAAPPLVP